MAASPDPALSPAQALPPLPALRAFAAAARLGGFARAADALHVSTSAVSHQIRALEERLGARLLERSTGLGGVKLTESGRMLLDATEQALALLDDACARVRGPRRRRTLTVSANAPVSALWLARRLAQFSAAHPGIGLNAVVHDDVPDLSRRRIDLAVINVKPDAVRPGDTVLLRETVFPVCSPELLPFAAHNVCKCRLLQEAHDNSPEIDWRTWAAHFGLHPDYESKIVRYSSFSQVVGAAIGGAGIALGRSPLIDDELRSGRLVRMFPGVAMPASWCFVLRTRPGREGGEGPAAALAAFLRAEAGAEAVEAA